MMIFIGSAAMFSLYNWMKREKKRLKHINRPVDEEFGDGHPTDGLPLPVKTASDAHTEAHDHHLTHLHSDEGDAVDENKTLWQKFTQWRMGDTFTDTSTSAYVVGGLHGVSGLSGIVYVLPALFLDDNLRLFLYMLGFFMTSIASMTVVGGTIGLIPSSTKKLMFLNGFAGTVVLGVGIMWIVLTSMDKLDL